MTQETLSDDAIDWLAACPTNDEATAGFIVEKAGHGVGANNAFAHWARKHPEWIERRFEAARAGQRYMYSLTTEGAAVAARFPPALKKDPSP